MDTGSCQETVEKKAVLGYLHTRFSLSYVREKKRIHPASASRPCSACNHPVLYSLVGYFFERRGPAPVGAGGHCAERLSNLIPGMDGFWLVACQPHECFYTYYIPYLTYPHFCHFYSNSSGPSTLKGYLPGSPFPVSRLIVFYFNILV